MKKSYITCLLVFIFCVNLNAVEITKNLLMDISRTYGYVTSQNLVAEKLKQKYPSKKYELYKAQNEFDLKFKSSIENMKKVFGKEWNNYQNMIMPKLIEEVNKINLDTSYKNGFANEILLRTKGNIESPVIETLLMFKPNYQKYPSSEFSDGFKKRLYSENNPKAKGVNFHVDIPKSWKVKEGKRPNTLWITSNNNGYLEEGDSSVSFTFLVNELPEKIHSLTTSDTKDFCDEIAKQGIVKECFSSTLENLPMIFARATMEIKRIRLSNKLEVANYAVFYKDKVIYLQGMVGTINNKLTQKQLNKKYDKYVRLFDQIANSLVVKDMY